MASAYADFMITVLTLDIGESVAALSGAAVPAEVAVQVENNAHPNAKMTKVTIITNQVKFARLQTALDSIGITGLTVTNVHGYGMQKGHTQVYRGVKAETRLLPKVQVDIVICKVPVDTLVKTVKQALYTGRVGDGKIFIYDVENVIKVSTGEQGFAALQDE
jgi:Amt family ammonium transporter